MSSRNKIINIVPILVVIGVFINQSGIIIGINFSLADIFLSIAMIILTISGQLYFNRNQTVFFLLLIITVMITGTIVNIFLLNSSVGISTFIKEYLKLFTLFLYMTLGYNLVRLKLLNICLKSFFIGSVAISVISIIYSIIDISLYRETLFFGINRFRGFMNDPNYFSVLQLTSLVYLLKHKDYKMMSKVIWSSTIVLSILLSGSKTGLVGLLAVMFFIIINNFYHKKLTRKKVIKLMISVLLISLLFIVIKDKDVFERFSKLHPSFERVYVVFNDLDRAVNDGGSGRGNAWRQAIDLIEISPVFGIGVGTYGSLNYILSGSKTIAHNTYLQLMVEWGTFLTFVFMIKIIEVVVRSFQIKNNKEFHIYRYMLLPFLIGSMSISLNNARLFWILFGALLYGSTYIEKSRGSFRIN